MILRIILTESRGGGYSLEGTERGGGGAQQQSMPRKSAEGKRNQKLARKKMMIAPNLLVRQMEGAKGGGGGERGWRSQIGRTDSNSDERCGHSYIFETHFLLCNTLVEE